MIMLCLYAVVYHVNLDGGGIDFYIDSWLQTSAFSNCYAGRQFNCISMVKESTCDYVCKLPFCEYYDK